MSKAATTETGALEIRDVDDAERPGVRRLVLDAYSEYASVLGDVGWNSYRANIVSTMADPGAADWVVAVRGGTPVGSVLLYPPDAVAYGRARTGSYPEVR